MPSTLAVSALLLSVSRSDPSATTSHEDMLVTCCGRADADGVPSGCAVSSASFASCSLQRVLECVRLMGSSLSDRYPAVGASADLAAEHITRYAGWKADDDCTSVAVPESATTKLRAACTVEEKQPGATKGRRCSTPTGVEGIMHIEMAAIRNASGVGGGKASDGVAGAAVPAKRPAAQQLSSIRGGGAVDLHGTSPKHARPTPISVAGRPPRRVSSCTAAPAAAAAPVARQRSFSFSDGDIAFVAVAANKKVASAAGDVQAATTTGGGALMGAGATGLKKNCGFSAWNPFSSAAAVAGQGGTMSLAGRKRSAGALGHCESGSGFGAPALRVQKAARISTTAG